MTQPHPATLRSDIVAIARAAGDAILAVYAQDFDVDFKADASPLTEADLASHRHIVAALSALTPELPILSEESAEIPYDERADWRTFWLVDPLDGTKEFVKRNGEFTVNIALIQGGRPVLGVVHAPVLGVTYSAAEGEGAFRHDGDAETAIVTRPPQGRRLTVVASRSHSNEATAAFLEELGRDFDIEVTSKGSALKICLVADGEANLYPRTGPTMEWDTAAAQAVLEAAGGVMAVFGSAEPLRYNKADLRNPHFLAAYGSDAPGLPAPDRSTG
jgi:3'(2'), 5'-bisphosphate nucleotidase